MNTNKINKTKQIKLNGSFVCPLVSPLSVLPAVIGRHYFDEKKLQVSLKVFLLYKSLMCAMLDNIFANNIHNTT